MAMAIDRVRVVSAPAMCRTWRVSSPTCRRVPGQGPAARSSSGRGVLDSGTCVSGGREAGLTDVELSGELFNVSDTVPACPTRSVWHAVHTHE